MNGGGGGAASRKYKQGSGSGFRDKVDNERIGFLLKLSACRSQV